MIIDSLYFDRYLKHLLKLGLAESQNTKLYYDIINEKELAKFMVENGIATSHFKFLYDILDNQELTKCPSCGHYNDNIECPILRCEICDHQWKITTPSTSDVCIECVAFKTSHCKGNKIKDGSIKD